MLDISSQLRERVRDLFEGKRAVSVGVGDHFAKRHPDIVHVLIGALMAAIDHLDEQLQRTSMQRTVGSALIGRDIGEYFRERDFTLRDLGLRFVQSAGEHGHAQHGPQVCQLGGQLCIS
ncbi:hypothetical protein D3C86_1569170 [compost metagenome]